MDRDSPIRALCDAHAIPVILYLDENGPGTKTEVYAAVGRNANMPAKLRRLEAVGLLTMEHRPEWRSTLVGLTETGARVARILREIDGMMVVA